MTEEEWLTGTGDLLTNVIDKASDRKLRLFACACCRRVGDYLWSGSLGQAAILTAEKFADGITTTRELDALQQLVEGQLELYPEEPVYEPSYWVCARNIREAVERSALYAANLSTLSIAPNADYFDARCKKRWDEELAAQVSLLRDIFGNPFRSQPTVDSSWLSWNDGVIPKLAQAIYDDRAFDRLPILADALEEAGCTNADILNHCRQPGEHVRGCWVVDLVLGKS